MKVKGSATKKGRRSSRTKIETQPAHMFHNDATTTPGASSSEQDAIARGGVATPFPWKLHEMLEDASKEGNEWIVSWQAHGRSFIVHKPKIFVEKIMPTYFNQSKFASFQRQLNLYGFSRLTAGKDKGAYYHNCFVRGQVALCRGMIRQKIKGTKVRRTLKPEEEPDFYKTPVEREVPPLRETSAQKTPEFTIEPKVETSAPEEEHVEAMVTESTTPVSRSFVPCVPFARSLPPLAAPTKDVISAKERAHKLKQDHKLRQERLDAVRDALKQTEIFCEEDEPRFQESLPTISLKPLVPSVSPLDSEVSDYEDDNSSIFTPQRLQKFPPMPALPNPPLVQAKLEPMPLEPRFTAHEMTQAQIQGGDVLFFEGKPFRYLEHLDSLPPPAPVAVSAAPQQKPKQFASTSYGGFARDSLQSLMRVDPQALMSAGAFNMRQTQMS